MEYNTFLFFDKFASKKTSLSVPTPTEGYIGWVLVPKIVIPLIHCFFIMLFDIMHSLFDI